MQSYKFESEGMPKTEENVSDWAARSVQLEGLPVFSGKVLTAADPIFSQLRTTEDYSRLARRLRGPFLLIVREPKRTTVVTDFGACIPAYYLENGCAEGNHRVSSSLGELRPYSSGRISASALFRYASWMSGVAQEPLYADVRAVPSGSVMEFTDTGCRATPYLDWAQLGAEEPMSEQDAQRRFFEIAGEYLNAIARSEGEVACLLSGGTDSALVALVLKRVGCNFRCITADYAFRKYSEWDLAQKTAQVLNLRQERVLVSRADHRHGYEVMNSRAGNVPMWYHQVPTLYKVGQYALERNIRHLFTGDNAGPIFLEFDYFFEGLPTDTERYLECISRMSSEDKVSRAAGHKAALTPFGKSILAALGGSSEQFCRWADADLASARRVACEWNSRLSLPALQSVLSQLSAGVAQQNQWLPAQIALGGKVQLLSPFLDIEMIKFAISLPPALKFRDGITKYLLKAVLKTELGIQLPKKPSPNPSRVWTFVPALKDMFRVDARLRPLFARQLAANVAQAGGLYSQLLYTKALGMWLQAHQLNTVSAGE